MTVTEDVARTEWATPDGSNVRLAIIGEYNPAFPPHDAVVRALAQAQEVLQVGFTADWIGTDTLETQASQTLRRYDALWIAPGSPYRSLDGALNAIRYAREKRVPLLGTCGGFQHVILEFGRNVLGLASAQHEEIDPRAECLIVTALTCSPAGQTMPVRLDADSRVALWYGARDISEKYFCSYGINPVFESRIHDAGLRIVGRDPSAEPRVVDLEGHPFFVGALFVPHPVTGGGVHALVAALARAAQHFAGSARTMAQDARAR